MQKFIKLKNKTRKGSLWGEHTVYWCYYIKCLCRHIPLERATIHLAGIKNNFFSLMIFIQDREEVILFKRYKK